MPVTGAGNIASAQAFGTLSITAFVQVLGGIASAEVWGAPQIPRSGSDDTLFINGQSVAWRESTFRLTRRLNGRDQATFSMRYRTGPRPQPFQECILTRKGVRRFGGVIEDFTETALEGHDDETRLDVTASGYDSFFDDVVVNRLYSSATATEILTDLWSDKLKSKGVTFTAGRDGDPGVTFTDINFSYVSGSEVRNQILARAPGWSVWVDENRELRLKQTNGVAANAPFSVGPGSANWDTLAQTVSKSRMRNQQYVLTGKDGIGGTGGGGVTERWTITEIDNPLYGYVYLKEGDAGTSKTVMWTNQPLRAKETPDATGRHPADFIVTVNGTLLNWGNQLDGYGGPGEFDAYFVPGDRNFTVSYLNSLASYLVANPGGLMVGDVIEMTTSGGVSLGNSPDAVRVSDAASIAANGLVESVYHAKSVVSRPTALLLGNGLIALNGSPSESATLTWNSKQNDNWLAPGMVIEIDKDRPEMSGGYTVQQVDSSEQDLALWRHTATLSKGPGDVTDAMQTDELLVATRLPTSPKQVLVTFRLGVDVAGATNPGIVTGLSTDFEVMPTVLGGITPKGWLFIAPTDPPTGTDLIVDVEVDGVSIFSSPPTIPAGSTAQQTGFTFTASNLRYTGGEIVRVNVLQVGSGDPGKRASLTLVLVG